MRDLGTSKRPHVVWRIGAVMAATIAIWGLMVWISTTVFGDDLTIANRIVNALVILGLTVPMVVAARRYLDRRPWSGLQLTGPAQAWRPFLIGVVAFLLPSAVSLTVALSAGWVQLSVDVPVAELLAWVALLVVLVFAFEALPEELIFRGYIYRNLSAAMAPWLAVVGQAVLFAAFGTALWVFTAGLGVLVERLVLFLAMAVVIGCIRVITGNVWACVGFHLAFQVVAQTVLGERVSTDNEGLLMVVAIVVAFVFATTITSWLSRSRANWTRPEPDPAA